MSEASWRILTAVLPRLRNRGTRSEEVIAKRPERRFKDAARPVKGVPNAWTEHQLALAVRGYSDVFKACASARQDSR
jgi:hypothetical protein